MAVFRVEKTKDFTIMCNHHLRNTELSLKAKGLLSLMLSLPEDWDYTTKGLAHATLQELKGWKWDGYRLSLGGTSHVALTAFLKRHPEIRRVSLYMDNDLGGLKNARRIKAMLHEDQRFKHIRVGINPPRIGKDYNEMLLHVTEKMKDHQQQCHRKQAAISI